MKETSNNSIENLSINFYEVIYGWIYFKVEFENQLFEGRFSHVFDPIIDLKNWLEAISVGVQQTSFVYHPEGYEIKFDFQQTNYENEVFTITEQEETEIILLKAKINRRQLVKSFYLGLLLFASSDKFVSKEWEVELLKERLCKILELDENSLIEELADLDKLELGELLFNSDPSYLISFPNAKDKSEEIKLYIESIIENKNSSKKIHMHS